MFSPFLFITDVYHIFSKTSNFVFYAVITISGGHKHMPPIVLGSVRVAERLALPTSDHGVAGSNPAVGEILPEPKRRFIAQSLSCSPFHRLEMTEILLKVRKTLPPPSHTFQLYWDQ